MDRVFFWAGMLGCVVFAMDLCGGMGAGTGAGFVFNSFPLINGQLLPIGLRLFLPWGRNIF